MKDMMQELSDYKALVFNEWLDSFNAAEERGLSLKEVKEDVEVRVARERFEAVSKAFSIVSDAMIDFGNLVSAMSSWSSSASEKRAKKARITDGN